MSGRSESECRSRSFSGAQEHRCSGPPGTGGSAPAAERRPGTGLARMGEGEGGRAGSQVNTRTGVGVGP